jgi:hypothetical protein
LSELPTRGMILGGADNAMRRRFAEHGYHYAFGVKGHEAG